MKKMRKGFTLVELLIVIAVLGALSAAMTMASSTATAKAKAASIANNLKVCTSGAQVYNFEHANDSSLKDVTTTAMLGESVPNFTDFTIATADATTDKDTIVYEAVDVADTEAPAKWSITVTLKGTDRTNIVAALKTMKGFKKLTDPTANSDKDYVITYLVFAGTATGKTSE